MDISFRLKVKDMWKRLWHWGLTRSLDGTGLVMARALRRWFVEYLDRMVRHGPYSLPGSFNVAESFLKYSEEYLAFDIRDEAEHLLSADAYFDWYTGNPMPAGPEILLDVMQEGLIYSYSMANDAAGFRLCCSETTFVIAGVSLVRHGDELSCVLVAGETPPYPADDEISDPSGSYIPCQGHERLTPDPALGIADRYLSEFTGFVRVILLTRFNLRARKYDVRYVNVDLGTCYRTFTDDMTALDDLPDEKRDRMTKSILEGLARYDELFATATSLIYLPVCFIDMANHADDLEFRTELFARTAEEGVHEAIKLLGEDACTFTRMVRCLGTIAGQGERREMSITPPDLTFESNGYWRPISPGEVGSDKYGSPIVGRTWVTRHESWSAHSLASCLLKRKAPPPLGPDPGTIYIMRSSAHDQDVYKVGVTRRAPRERARELSSSTGVPLPLSVLAKWQVGDCRAVEAEAHRRLEAHRINPRREFFHGELSVLIATIEKVTRELASDSA